MATKKDGEKKVPRDTLVKALKKQFPDLFKKPSGGPRFSAAALDMLSPTLRKSVMDEMKKKTGKSEVTYTPEEIGEFVLSAPQLPCNK